MKGWWLKHPYYLKYMIRESTAVFVTVYALILLNGAWNLRIGQAHYEAWLASLQHPLAIGFHLVAMAAAAYHTFTWFHVSPKVVPHFYMNTRRIPDALITGVQYVIAGICYTALFLLVRGV
jgi:fumarate reductase subunit C